MKDTSLVAGIVLAGCLLSGFPTTGQTGESTDEQENSVPLTRSQLYAYFSEHTQLRSDGHTFYSEFGTFQALIQNKIVEGTWSSHDGGKMCRHFEKGDEGRCEIYVFDGDGVSWMRNGIEFLPPEIVSGNSVVVKDMYTQKETRAMISGKTVLWPPNGGAYYMPDGTLMTLWDGVKEEGTWEVNDEGGVCWKVPSWGNVPCEFYYRGKKGLMAISGSEDSEASEHREGNVLDSL